MKKVILPLLAALAGACAAPAEPVRDPATLARLAEAQELMRAGSLDDALLITDELLRADPDLREARLLRAEGNLALVESGRKGTQYLLQDAVRDLEAAVDLDPNDPDGLFALAEARLRNAEFAGGRDAAAEAVRLYREQKAPAEKIAAAILCAADNEMQMFVERRRAELVDKADPSDGTKQLANAVLTTLNMAHSAGAISAAALRSAQVYQWLGKEKQALDLLEAGVRAAPSDESIHNAYQQLFFDLGMRRECVAAYKRLLKESPGNASLTWYLGRAQVALADDHRAKTEWDAATRAYAEAQQTYRDYVAKRPGDKALAGHWLAICELSLGRVALEQGALERAKGHFYAAYDAAPAVAEYDGNGMPRIYDSFGGNYVGGLFLIGKALSDAGGSDGLQKSLAFYEEILHKHEGRFGAIYNNAALSARDLGTDLERRGDVAAAMALYEKSYAWYQKAVELEPNDARIVNDCGLMLVYHLRRDYDEARALFDRAIALGEEQLAALPDDAGETARQSLEEAVGDAWQNIAVMLTWLQKSKDEIRPMLVEAVKYYPYQRREAARTLARLDRGGEAQEAAAPQQDPRKGRFDAEVVKARAKAAENDFDGALAMLDPLSTEMNGYAPYHYHVGLYSLGYAEQAAADGKSIGLVDGLYNDALRQLRKAVELDGAPSEPRIELARALLATGDAAAAAREANSALSHARSLGGAGEALALRIHAIRAQAHARTYVKAREEGGTNDDALRDARVSFRALETAGQLDARLRNTWTSLERWAGADAEAVGVLARALAASPDDAPLVAELVDLASQIGKSELAVEALEGRDDAQSLWYSGRAHFDLAQSRWAGGDAESAIATLDRSVERFEQSMAKNPQFTDSCRQWIALSRGSQGLVRISREDWAGAQAALLDGLRTAPNVLTNDLGGGSSIKRGILIVGDKHFQAGDLAKTEALYRAACELAPNDVDLANNHGLFARDHGVELERQGNAAAAVEMFEQSYAAYTRAATLDPANIRLRNDRALLLIYHLNRELDLAVELLQSAIADGEARLAEAPPTDATELRDLQEAVGDAFGNLGYYHLNRTKDYPAARQAIEKSLTFYPFAQRAGTALLQRLDRLEKGQGDGK